MRVYIYIYICVTGGARPARQPRDSEVHRKPTDGPHRHIHIHTHIHIHMYIYIYIHIQYNAIEIQNNTTHHETYRVLYCDSEVHRKPTDGPRPDHV